MSVIRRKLTRERLYEHVHSLVAVLVTTGGEEVERVVEVKVVVAVEMASDEVIDLLLRDSVEVLELVHGRELGHVETVGRDTV